MFEDSHLSHLHLQTFSREELKVLGDLAEEKSTAIESSNEGLCVVVWDIEDYLKEVDR